MSKPSLLFCASEVYPFAKTGGLADVAHALPRALQESYDLQVVLPLYAPIDKEKFSIVSLKKSFALSIGEASYEVELFGSTYEGMEYIFIYSPVLCEREFLYGTPTEGYIDNALRFAIFNYAILKLLEEQEYDIVHLNDWQSALVPLLLQEHTKIKTKTLLTIHNLAYQGLFPYETLFEIGINTKYFTVDALEFYGKINFMKAGIAYADAVTTVSPSYVREILTPEFGCGLDGFLLYHRQKLSGILNGIDTEHFNPQNDKLIERSFTTLTEKMQNKKAYLKEAGLLGIKKPLFAFIGRFTEQKGVNLLIETLDELASMYCNIVILGDGEKRYQEAINEIAKRYKNIHFEFIYNESLAHRIYASCDFLLMPSLFEPCGLNQMIAMKYGALPIVHKIGGLKDSVQNYKRFNPKSKKGYGIGFSKANADSFLRSLKEAHTLYDTKREYNLLVKHNMLCDFSWKKSAELYKKLYKKLEGALDA